MTNKLTANHILHIRANNILMKYFFYIQSTISDCDTSQSPILNIKMILLVFDLSHDKPF